MNSRSKEISIILIAVSKTERPVEAFTAILRHADHSEHDPAAGILSHNRPNFNFSEELECSIMFGR